MGAGALHGCLGPRRFDPRRPSAQGGLAAGGRKPSLGGPHDGAAGPVLAATPPRLV